MEFRAGWLRLQRVLGLFVKKRLPVDRVIDIAREAYRLGYLSGDRDNSSGLVTVEEVPTEEQLKEQEDVSADTAADSRSCD